MLILSSCILQIRNWPVEQIRKRQNYATSKKSKIQDFTTVSLLVQRTALSFSYSLLSLHIPVTQPSVSNNRHHSFSSILPRLPLKTRSHFYFQFTTPKRKKPTSQRSIVQKLMKKNPGKKSVTLSIVHHLSKSVRQFWVWVTITMYTGVNTFAKS